MEREPPSLLHPPLPCFFFFFAPIFISRRSQLSERLEHSKNCPSALLSSCHFQWSTQVTYWNWLPVSVTGVLLSAYSTVARSIALPLVRSCCLCLVLSFFLFFFCLLICFWSLASLLSVCQLFISITSLFLSLDSSKCPNRDFLHVKRLSLFIWRLHALPTTKGTILQFLLFLETFSDWLRMIDGHSFSIWKFVSVFDFLHCMLFV